MPLRDHFHPPLDRLPSPLAMWPMVIIQQLFHRLPEYHRAAPRIRGVTPPPREPVVVRPVSPPPTFTTAVELPTAERCDVRVYASGRELVSVVKLVGPSNKDRAENRRRFVGECVALLADGVSVAVVDLVTAHGFNLYADLLDELQATDPVLPAAPSATYAVALRRRSGG